MITTTRFQAMTAGTSIKTMTVHGVIDTVNDKVAFFMTRTPLELKRCHQRADEFAFLVGIEVPIDSAAALLALEHWLKG